MQPFSSIVVSVTPRVSHYRKKSEWNIYNYKSHLVEQTSQTWRIALSGKFPTTKEHLQPVEPKYPANCTSYSRVPSQDPFRPDFGILNSKNTMNRNRSSAEVFSTLCRVPGPLDNTTIFLLYIISKDSKVTRHPSPEEPCLINTKWSKNSSKVQIYLTICLWIVQFDQTISRA